MVDFVKVCVSLFSMKNRPLFMTNMISIRKGRSKLLAELAAIAAATCLVLLACYYPATVSAYLPPTRSSQRLYQSVLFRRQPSAPPLQSHAQESRQSFPLSLMDNSVASKRRPNGRTLWASSRTADDTSSSSSTASSSSSSSSSKFLETLVTSVSQTAAVKAAAAKNDNDVKFKNNDSGIMSPGDRRRVNLITLSRVAIPSIFAGIIASLLFPGLSIGLATTLNDTGVFAVLSQDSSQFVQNFLTVSGLLFSILVGQTYYFMYQQQESVYYALFNEVTEAKSLLEQVALVCQGRSMYARCLDAIYRYVQDDLKKLSSDPAVLLSARPVDDPLESIMYMTSVGVPSTVYETVRSLRQARASRLGALQRKLPTVHMGLLWILAMIELVSFPLLGAGTQTIGGYRLLTVEGILFGVMTSGIVLTLRVVGELWRPAGGAYNVDYVLSIMVRGLLEELRARMAGAAGKPSSSSGMSADDKAPSPPRE